MQSERLQAGERLRAIRNLTRSPNGAVLAATMLLTEAKVDRSTIIGPRPGQAATKSRYRNIGRNESCPCGSGVKFKRCCKPGRVA